MDKAIELQGVKQNNLKNISLSIPLGQMTVITGVSGSGKSSLAFDTLYAEGSRRYMESLSTYARQFLEKLSRPEVDAIHNVPPAIALEQRNSINNNRTTVATMTEIYDYLRLLYAAVGTQPCQACGHPEVKITDVENIVDKMLKLPEGTRFYLVAPILVSSLLKTEGEDEESASKKKAAKKDTKFLGQELYKRGFQRILVKNEVVDLASVEGQIHLPESDLVHVVVDRFAITTPQDMDRSRLTDSAEQALIHGSGTLELYTPEGKRIMRASRGYACADCGEVHTMPTASLFSSNSPLGACQTCSGFGEILELDEDLIVPDKARAIRDGAIDPLAKPSNQDWEKAMLRAVERRGLSVSTRYKDLSAGDRKFLWDGDDKFPGIKGYFEQMKAWKYKLHVRVFIRRYQSLRVCPDCGGSRLSAQPLRFTVAGKNVAEFMNLTVNDAMEWVEKFKLTKTEELKIKEVRRQIQHRLQFLQDVGVGYLKINRKGNSLSGGECQRISLAAQLGAKLSNTLYVLDEPSIGLHAADTERLIKVIKELRDHGNTLVVVEHDSAVIQAADYLVEVGPQAGRDGGHVVAASPKGEFLRNRASLTARYLSGELVFPKRAVRRPVTKKDKFLTLSTCKGNNLKGVDFALPLERLVAVTGVSGSGKSTLIHDTLYKILARMLLREPISQTEIGAFEGISGVEHLRNVILLDQTPIGRSTRSNPATYMKMYDEVRRIMASQPAAVRQKLTPSDFSFNVDGGRCPVCNGDGYVEVDMHFMANVRLVCDTCEGKRFKKHVLAITFRDKNIDEILHTTVKEAATLFADYKGIVEKCHLLDDVGLGYLQLGQSISTLSGGECQRLKIASSLDEQKTSGKFEPTLYIFDEPTTGLHLHDVKKLGEVLHGLVEKGNSVVFIEHHLELIGQADWVIDLGPGGGDAGGSIVAQGTPEQIVKASASLTGKHLAHTLPKK